MALNCVANGRILREGPFERIWIQPAAGDAGGALGVALFIWHQLLDHPRQPDTHDSQRGSRLGPAPSDREIAEFLDQPGAVYHRFASDEQKCDQVAELLAAGQVVGWVQGRMEFGPRALGSRSILGDARNPQMQAVMNLKIKFRESFRPFAPSVLQERVHDYFEMRPHEPSPYMLLVAPVRHERRVAATAATEHRHGLELRNAIRSEIPAVTHVDYSARVQTVDERTLRSLLPAAQGVRAEDRLPGDHQHQLQYPRRTDRLFAGRSLSMLPGHEHGCPGDRGLPAAQVRAAGCPAARDRRVSGEF